VISIVIPSRGRPDSLRRAVSSLAFGDIEIIVGLDIDDPTADEAEAFLATVPLARVVRSTRFPTMPQLFNYLVDQTQGDIILGFPDDYVMDHKDWAEKVRHTTAMLPNELGVAYLDDPCYPGFSTFPVLSRRSIEMAGFFLPPFFPFLFGDTWWNEVGILSGMHLRSEASVSIQQDAGHDHHYRDIALWTQLFERTRPIREDMAIKMLRDVFGETEECGHLISTMKGRVSICEEFQKPFMTPDFQAKWNATGFIHPHYDAMKSKAEAFLKETA